MNSGIAEESPVNYHRCLSCTSTIVQENGQLTSTYCNKRFCAVCSNRRTAILIDKFEPVLENSISNDHEFKHITLTLRTFDNNNLEEDFKKLQEVWKRTRRSIRNAFDGGSLEHITSQEQLNGILRFEINYNNVDYSGKFHPHIHLLVRGNHRLSRFIKKKWLKFARKLGNNPEEYAQETSNVYSTDGLKEVTKYVHKPLNDEGEEYPPEVIDEIWRLVKGRRMLRSYGVFRNKEKELEEEVEEELEEQESTIKPWKREDEEIIWEWHTEEKNWIDEETGDFLLNDASKDAHTGTRARALTRKDNSYKPGLSGLTEDTLKQAYPGHFKKLEPDKHDRIYKKRIFEEWEKFKKRKTTLEL